MRTHTQRVFRRANKDFSSFDSFFLFLKAMNTEKMGSRKAIDRSSERLSLDQGEGHFSYMLLRSGLNVDFREK